MELAAGCLLILVWLAFVFGVDLLLAWGCQAVLESILGHSVSYWACFAGVCLLSLICGGGLRVSSK